MNRRIGVALVGIATLAAGCGGPSTAPTATGVSITGLVVQIQNDADGGHSYVVSYTVTNGGPGDATLTSIDAALSAKGAPIRSFSAGFPTGRSVPASQSIAPTVTTFTTPAEAPVADSLTLTVHYQGSAGDQTVSRTVPLG